jgi:hypothetical protein
MQERGEERREGGNGELGWRLARGKAWRRTELEFGELYRDVENEV